MALLPASRVWSVLLAALAAPASAQHPGVSFGPAPSWVEPADPGAEAPADPATQVDGLEHLLVSDQVRSGDGPRESYRRHVYRVLEEKGVRDASQVQIDFDPAYQTLVVHGITLRRGDEEVWRATEASLKVLEREPGLESQVYTERSSVLAIVDDVRIGDRIETEYTLRGENDVFEGRFASSFDLAWVVPCRRRLVRVLVPADRPLRWRFHASDERFGTSESDGWTELRLDLAGVAAVVPESELPGSFEPFPYVEVSEYAGWEDVARWGVRQYALDPEPGGAVRATADRIAAEHEGLDARILAAWALVRDEVRYLSLALGPGSHRPSRPEAVLARRFGDCKDKAMLLVALLDRLGVRARPALVSTVTRDRVGEKLPSPFRFDHVVVRVERGERPLWLDPTDLHARGDLDHVACPRFGAALVLDEATTGLEAIEPPSDDRPRFHVRKWIEARDVAAEATIRIETTYALGDADAMRARVRESGAAALEKSYLDFYARTYPPIRATRPLEVRDDELANEVVVTEEYAVPGFWRSERAGAAPTATIAAEEISAYVSTPATTRRTMPLAVPHPVRATFKVIASLPGTWEIEPVRERIDSAALRFRFDLSASGSQVSLDYELETLADSVPPEEALAHVERLDRISEQSQYVLTSPAEGDGSPPTSWILALAFALISFALTAVGAALLFLYRPAPRPASDPIDARLHGIRGWLALCAVGVVATPLVILSTLVASVPAYEPSRWADLTTPGSAEYHPLWATTLLVELFGNVAMLNVSVVLAALFLMKRRSFPPIFVVSRAAWVLFLFATWILALMLPGTSQSPAGILGTTLASLAWIAYFLRSKRVRATFVR